MHNKTKQKRKNDNSTDEGNKVEQKKMKATAEETKPNVDEPVEDINDPRVRTSTTSGPKIADDANVFDSVNVKDTDISAVIGSLNSGNDYILHISVCPVVPRPTDGKNGPVQRSVVAVIRFQKSYSEVDCWCVKPAYLIDSIRAVKKLVPKAGMGEFFNSLREYALREAPQGPSIPLTRNTRNGGRFETRVLAGFIPLGPSFDHRMVASGIGNTLSDFLRSKLFEKIYLDIAEESSKDNNSDTGRQGIYGIIKDPNYFFWEALKKHRLVVSWDVPLDTFFLDPAISEMVSRMFPDDGDYLNSPEVKAVAYKSSFVDDVD